MEQPLSGRHGLQLWVDLPPELKLVEPSYTSLRETSISEIEGGGSHLYVVAGDVNGVHGPMALSGRAIYARLQLALHETVALEVDATVELGLYVLQGRVEVGGVPLAAGMLGLLGSGTYIQIAARGDETVELAFIGGERVQSEFMFSGPFVMDTPEWLVQATQDFVTARMGRLEGVSF